MSKRNSRKRRAQVSIWALELAKSGTFASWRSIELYIRVNGFPEAKINDPFTKRELDESCAAGRQGAVND